MIKIKSFVYCMVMKFIWRAGHDIYVWAETRRPEGGFVVKKGK